MNISAGIKDFFKDIGNFFGSRRILGVDIGTVGIKIAELSRKGSKIALENYGILQTKTYLERANGAIQASSLQFVEKEVSALLRTLLQEMRPQSRRVVASVPAFAAFMAPIEMPLMPQEETARSVPFQARQCIPMPIEEVSIDWVKVGEFENERGQRYQRVLITAIPNEVIAKYKAVFRAANLSLAALEVEYYALARALAHTSDAATLIMDIGAMSTDIVVAERGAIQSIGQTDYGGFSLTQALARSLDISPWRAEELKQRKGLLSSGREFDLSTSLTPFMDVIIGEGGRVRSAFERATGRKVERFTLAGGGADLPGIDEYIRARTGLVFMEARPFSHFSYPDALEPAVRSLNCELAVAVGLAMRFYV